MTEETAESLIVEKKAETAKWFRSKAIHYREQANNKRDLTASMLKDATSLDERAAKFDAAADALELEVTGNW